VCLCCPVSCEFSSAVQGSGILCTDGSQALEGTAPWWDTLSRGRQFWTQGREVQGRPSWALMGMKAS
jgi:hypothetical protein